MRRRFIEIVVGGLVIILAMAACTRGDAPKDDKSGGVTSSTAADISCKDKTQKVSQTLSTGATWTMCWGVHPDFGLTLSNVTITPPGKKPIKVIGDMSLSQLEVPYDTGEQNTSDITAAGFGGRKMKTLDTTACAGDLQSAEIPKIGDGTYGETETRKVLCSETMDSGISYHSSDRVAPAEARANAWRLFTISRVGWYEYSSQYTFGADGTIDVQLGATGDLSPIDYTDKDHGSDVGDHEYAASHAHNAVWRVHWGLGSDGGQKVQQYDAEATGKSGSKSAIFTGGLKDLDHPTLAHHADRRWWRVLNPDVRNDDGHPISYQIEIPHTDPFEFFDDTTHDHKGGYDVAFTNADECELYATENRGDCGRGVQDFVADSKKETLDDVVSWVAVGFHHVPRDEDQSPMGMHWQGFTMMPRDLTAQRFDLPDRHEEQNGVPDTEWNVGPTD